MQVAEVGDKKRILFVDDEASILSGIKRMLHPMREEWDMAFAGSGAEALAMLKSEPVDLLVADLRMPQMDGVQLLTRVKQEYPNTVRFVLSGYADRFMILRCAGPAHQFLVKPCESEQLVLAARRAFALRELLNSHRVRKMLQEDAMLPSLPGLYAALMKALQSPDSSMAEIASIIAKDTEMAEKMLRLVNSTFMVYIENIHQAVSYLGAEAMSAIALTTGLFDQFVDDQAAEFGIKDSYDHSMSVGAIAGRWMASTFKNRKMTEEATMAGMTHDFGKLVMIRNMPDAWREAHKLSVDRHLLMHAAEREVLGVTHAEIGALLLNHWGVADNIVEAVAFHHRPSECLGPSKNSLFAVHVANALSHKWQDKEASWNKRIDLNYVKAIEPHWHLESFEAAAGVRA